MGALRLLVHEVFKSNDELGFIKYISIGNIVATLHTHHTYIYIICAGNSVIGLISNHQSNAVT